MMSLYTKGYFDKKSHFTTPLIPLPNLELSFTTKIWYWPKHGDISTSPSHVWWQESWIALKIEMFVLVKTGTQI